MDVERRLPICFQTLVREFQVSRRHESRIGELIVGNVIGKRGKLVVERRRKRIRFDEERRAEIFEKVHPTAALSHHE